MPGESKKKTAIPEEELRIRLEEEKLFAGLAAPSIGTGMSSMADDDSSKAEAPAAKKGRPGSKKVQE